MREPLAYLLPALLAEGALIFISALVLGPIVPIAEGDLASLDAFQTAIGPFAAAVEKSRELWGEAAVEKATEQLCSRLDIFLQRCFHQCNDAQRGLIIFSEGRLDARAKLWVRGFHQRGTTWGAINNLADIPYFASMRESRLLQAADFISHAVWLLYERRDPSLIRDLIPCSDATDGVVHGLVHIRSDVIGPCDCPACYSRRNRGALCPWLGSENSPDSHAF